MVTGWNLVLRSYLKCAICSVIFNRADECRNWSVRQSQNGTSMVLSSELDDMKFKTSTLLWTSTSRYVALVTFIITTGMTVDASFPRDDQRREKIPMQATVKKSARFADCLDFISWKGKELTRMHSKIGHFRNSQAQHWMKHISLVQVFIRSSTLLMYYNSSHLSALDVA